MPEWPPDIADELLSAAVDNALSEIEQARVGTALERDPAVRRQLEAFGRLKRRVRAALAPGASEPDLEALMTRALDAVDAERRALPRPAWRAVHLARLWRLAPAVVAGVALFGLVVWNLPTQHGEVRVRVTLAGPDDGGWELNPARLAASHAKWTDHFRMWPQPVEQLTNIAQRLSSEVGYPVLPPDLESLDAKLYGAIADSGASGRGHLTAVLLLRRSDGRELSLFQIAAAPRAVRVVGFRRSAGAAVRTAVTSDTRLALFSEDRIHVCLASNSVPLESLVKLAPRAVRWDQAPPAP